jgi:hypothetical protein
MKKTLISFAFLLAALPAQDASPFRFAPADSALVLRIGAPAKWKQRFAGTEIAKVADGENFGPMLAQMGQMFAQGMAELRESGKVDADLLDKFVREYKGDMVLAVQMDMAKMAAAAEENEQPPMGLTVTLTPDGAFDLAAFAKELERVASDNPNNAAMRELTVGAHRLRFTTTEVGMKMALPTMIDGHLVMLGATDDFEARAPKLLAGDPFTNAAAKGNPAMFAYVGAGGVMDAMLNIVSEQAGGMLPVDIQKIWQISGFAALDEGTMVLDADGKHMVGDISLTMRGSELGFLAAMISSKAPALLRYVPANATSFSVSHLDFSKLYEVVGKIWAECEEASGMSFDEAQQAFSESAKIALKADLIDHLGDEMITLQDPEAMLTGDEGDSEDSMTAMMATLGANCWGVSLRNGKAFGESLDKMMRAQGMHAARKSEDYQGTKIYKLALGGLVELEYAITDDLMLLAVGKGESGRQSLRSILDTRAAPAAAGELPAISKAGMQGMPPGWCGLAVNPLGASLLSMAGSMESSLGQADDAPEELGMAVQMLKALGTDLQKLKIQSIGATYANPQVMQMRMRM